MSNRFQKMAHDAAPVDEDQINEVLTFLHTRLSDEDYAQVADMLDAVVDKAEDLNPTRAMAADKMPASTRRILRRVRRDLKLGTDARPAAVAMDEAQFNELFPHGHRLGDGGSIGLVRPMPPKPAKPTRPMTAAEKAEWDAAFPHSNRL